MACPPGSPTRACERDLLLDVGPAVGQRGNGQVDPHDALVLGERGVGGPGRLAAEAVQDQRHRRAAGPGVAGPGDRVNVLVDDLLEDFAGGGEQLQAGGDDLDGQGDGPVGGAAPERPFAVEDEGGDVGGGGLGGAQVVGPVVSEQEDGPGAGRVEGRDAALGTKQLDLVAQDETGRHHRPPCASAVQSECLRTRRRACGGCAGRASWVATPMHREPPRDSTPLVDATWRRPPELR